MRRVVFTLVRSVGIAIPKINSLFTVVNRGLCFSFFVGNKREPINVYAAADDAASAVCVGEGDAPRVREQVW